MPCAHLSAAAAALAVSILSNAQVLRSLSEPAEWIGSPALSPDGRTLAFDWEKADFSWGIFLRPLSGGQPVQFAGKDDKDGSPTSPRWSPDGARIAFSRDYCRFCDSQLLVKSYPRGVERPLGPVCRSPASWTPDGGFLIAGVPTHDSGDCRVTLIPVDGGRRIRLVATVSDTPAISPDGKRLAYAHGNQLKLASLSAHYRIAGAPVVLATESHAIASINWLPDGHALVYQAWSDGNYYSRLASTEVARSQPRLIDLGGNIDLSQMLGGGRAIGTEIDGPSSLWRIDLQASTQESTRVRDIPWTDQLLSVSADGQSLAFATNRNGPTQIWVSRIDGKDPRVLIAAIPPFDKYGDNTVVDGISWSPDGKWIAMLTEPGIGHGDEDARLFLVQSGGGQLRALVDCSQLPGGPPWSADSQFVFIAKDDESYKVKYYRVDVASGKETEVSRDDVPKAASMPLPAGAQQPHLAQGGRYLYFQVRERKPRLVTVDNFLPGSARKR